MRRLIEISFQIQAGKDISIYSETDIANAKLMYEYVYMMSNGFTCTRKYLETIWVSAYFKVAGYNGDYDFFND
jgi:hypothetical protein